MITTLYEYLNIQQNSNDNFWKWFGNSKVIENGKPLQVYHFSNIKFSSFKKRKGLNTNLFSTEEVERESFFFSPDKSFSSKHGKEEYDVYLKIENIFDFTKHYYYDGITVKSSDFFDEMIDLIENNGINLSMEYQSYLGELKIKPEYIWRFFDEEIGKILVKFLKLNGYDGVYFVEEETPVFAVFNSNQIKSVENDGTWDLNDNNIYS